MNFKRLTRGPFLYIVLGLLLVLALSSGLKGDGGWKKTDTAAVLTAISSGDVKSTAKDPALLLDNRSGDVADRDAVRLASIEPMADRWFNPALAPHALRWQLDLPGFEAIRAYLLETLETTLELLDKTADTDEKIFIGKGEQPAWLTLGLANHHGLVTGATGFIGRHLVPVLAKVYITPGFYLYAGPQASFLVSGKANVYDWPAPGPAVVRTAGAPYTTRILVRRPATVRAPSAGSPPTSTRSSASRSPRASPRSTSTPPSGQTARSASSTSSTS